MRKYLFILCLAFIKNSISSDFKKPMQPAEFRKDFVWINASKCNKPLVMPYQPIYLRDPKNEKSKVKIFVRRWLDSDGDGLCEVYDIGEVETSNFSHNIYGYPVRVSKYVDGLWKVSPIAIGAWVPLILLDRSNGERMQVDYVYGNAGYSAAARFIPKDCEIVRKYLAITYMLVFHFPQFAKNDPVTDPKGAWNDVISGWLNATYTDPIELRQLKLPTECKEKYRLIVSALVAELSR